MGYINDFRAKLTVLIEDGRTEEAVKFAADKVLESYRNGVGLKDQADPADVRKAGWCPSTPVMGKLATMDTIYSSFRPCCLVSASASSTRHQRGDTDSFQLVILLTVTARQSGDLGAL
jgi:hypothetical protein